VTDRGEPLQYKGEMNATALPVEAPAAPEFRALYRAHFDHVWRTLRRLGVAERDLEDAAHEVFVVAHRRLPDFDAARPPRPWLTGIAYRVASDDRKRARNRRELLGAPADLALRPAPGPNPEQAMVVSQARAWVRAALGDLPLDQRVVFVMHELDGTSCPEVAVALEVSVNTVYSRLRLGRQRFATAVRRLRAREGTR
jgi:RNA polymerase sigma-70 factor, ECF subfamily